MMPNEATLAFAPLLTEAEGEAAAFEVVEVGARDEVDEPAEGEAVADETGAEGEAADEGAAEGEGAAEAEGEASADEGEGAADSEGVSEAGASEAEPDSEAGASEAEAEAEALPPERHERSVPWMETGAEKAARPVLSRTLRVTWVPASMSMFQVIWWSLVPCERYLRAGALCWPPGMTETM